MLFLLAHDLADLLNVLLAHEWFHALLHYFDRTRMVNIAEHTGAKADDEFISKALLEFYIKGRPRIPAGQFEVTVAADHPTVDNFKQTARHHLIWQHIGESIDDWTKLDTVDPEMLHAFEQVVDGTSAHTTVCSHRPYEDRDCCRQKMRGQQRRGRVCALRP